MAMVPNLGLWDNIRFILTVTLLTLLRGSLGPSRVWLPIAVRLNMGAWTTATIDALRRKYKCNVFRGWFWFGPRSVIVVDGATIGAVLNSPANQADPPLKKKSLRRFIPDSILISRDGAWFDRRQFNERVLDSREKVHRHAAAFREIIGNEVGRMPVPIPGGEMRWRHFRALAQSISQQMLLGSGQLQPRLATEVDHLLARANWFLFPIWLVHPDYFASFYDRIKHALLSKNTQPCLLRDSAERYVDNQAECRTRVPGQVAFWVFVLREALELNVARTLVLIAAHPRIQDELRQRLQSALDIGGNIDAVEMVEDCVKEQLRLWTPTPLLPRRAIYPFELPGGIAVQAQEPLMLFPAYYHRDPSAFGHLAHRFCPHRVGRLPDTYFFSDGRQMCAGRNLALFAVRTTVAGLLTRFQFKLIGPSFDTERIPELYDHFHIRLRAIPSALRPARNAGSAAAARQRDLACHV